MTDLSVRPGRVGLDDKYLMTEGRALLSGTQALVRLTLDQQRLDHQRGLDTAIFVSGYQGSPLGTVDLEFGRAGRLLDADRIVFRAGLNEELAATAVAGTQLIGQVPGQRRDGVVGFWYGKNPGLDRAADAIRHGNFAGTTPLGGAVAWIGDDPGCKSSTLPSGCEQMAQSLNLPLLAPSNVGEILELGLHAVALSRFSGLWSGLKIVSDIADASSTVDFVDLDARIPHVDQSRHQRTGVLVGPAVVEAERELIEVRLPRVHDYVRQAGLNRIVADVDRPRLGVVAAGLAYATVLRSFERLGIDEAARQRLGIRLIKLDMPFPLNAVDVGRLVRGLEEVVVIEDRVSFVETQLKDLLYGSAHAPRIVGRLDRDGRPLLAGRGAADTDAVSRALASLLPEVAPGPNPTSARVRTTIPLRVEAPHVEGPPVEALAARTPYFCSGCPHNISTRATDDQLVGTGIGCHCMVALDGGGRGHLVGLTQMGGEGAQWIGLAPFTTDEHFFQNLGDGTFFHSGSLAVRAAVAAGVNLTYKLLYNDAVAMTGGQVPEGRLAIHDLTRWLALEGVKAVVVTTADPDSYRGIPLSPIAKVRNRDDLSDVQVELAATVGVTVLIHDDRCAAEERRLRKRQQLPAIAERVWINERVCEGCGDCGAASSCLSVMPKDTEFGRKTEIHQGSCNQDFSCLKGDCPSFVVVTPSPARPDRPAAGSPPVALGDPTLRVVGDDLLLRMPGIGGTGIVTVSQILQMAAHLDGWHAAGLEQTGLAQKGGPVISDVRLSRRPIDGALRASGATVDVLLAFDALGAADAATLATTDVEGTVAVVSTAEVPTAAMVQSPSVAYPIDDVRRRIDGATRRADNVYLPAQWIAERLFADHLPANLVMLGAAYQHGCLPVQASSIEEAIRLNGAGAAANLTAFSWGRAAVVDLDAVLGALSPPKAVDRRVPAADAMLRTATIPEPLVEVVGRRVRELVGYQDARYASRYLDQVVRVAATETERSGDTDLPISAAYARQLFKLLAYKDEYEVARLHLDTAEQLRLSAAFGVGARTKVMLHPPILRSLGLDRKISLGRATQPAFKMLHVARRLRGGPLDPFGRASLRRIERALPGEYQAMMDRALDRLEPTTAGLILELAETPDLIRGYEEIKTANIERFRAKTQEILIRLDAVAAQASLTGP